MLRIIGSGTQKKGVEGIKYNKWDVLGGNEEEREKRDKGERGNDSLSAKKRVDLKKDKKQMWRLENVIKRRW